MNKITFRLFIPVLIYSAGTFTVAAQSMLSEDEFFADLPPVNTVTRLPTPKSETPAAVTVIDREMIEASGARDLVDLLRLVPGFQVANPREYRPAATYHGLGDEYTRRMQILIDGRSVYGALFGHVAWSTQAIALEDIERIEVVRGPNAVTYGANAFLGTINIITRHSADSHGASLKVASGNHGVSDGLARFGTRVGAADIRLTASYSADNGLEEVPDDNDVSFLNFRMDWEVNDNDAVFVHAGISDVNAHEGAEGNVVFPVEPVNTDTHFEQLKWRHRISPENEFTIHLYNTYRKLDYSYLTDPINLGAPFGSVSIPISFNGVANRHGLEWQQTLSHDDDWRFLWGAGIYNDKVESMAYFSRSEPVSRDSSQLFTNVEWHIAPKIVTNLGLMWEDIDFIGSELSPRLALNYQVNSNHTLRIVGSKAFRTPSLFEEFGDFRFSLQNILLDQSFLSQGGLDTEEMISYELGYIGRFPRASTTLDVRIYRDELTKLITPVPVAATDLTDNLAIGYYNDAEVFVDGIDFELRYQPNLNTRIVMTLAGMHASAEISPGNILLSQMDLEDSIPKYSGSLLVSQKFNSDWHFSIGYYWVDEMLWLDAGNPVDRYGRFDLRIARRFRFGDLRGEIAVVVQNAGDRYQDFYREQYFGRRNYASLSVEF